MLVRIVMLVFYIFMSFNPAVGLYREAPNVAPNTHWVYSDAYLVGEDISGWEVPRLTKWGPLVEGKVVPEETFACIHYDIDLGGGIRSEAPDCSPQHMWDWWMSYADRILLAALNARNAGNTEREAKLMAIAHSMWNGKGMADKFHQDEGCYQTYHLALYYYMTGDEDALRVLFRMQERDPRSNRFGGIYTEYGEDLRPLPHTDTNIETTAVTLRAFQKHWRQNEEEVMAADPWLDFLAVVGATFWRGFPYDIAFLATLLWAVPRTEGWCKKALQIIAVAMAAIILINLAISTIPAWFRLETL